jgi:GNAT superfamily N-acetyltransferase
VTFQRIEKLAVHHQLGNFRCGAADIDSWLHERALKGQQSGNATVFVLTHQDEVVAFYALAASSAERSHSPKQIQRNAPDPLPVLLLARLGVDERAQKRGIGGVLLRDALLRSCRVANDIGFRALLVHCRDEKAKEFYQHLIPGFIASPTDELHLYLSLKTLIVATHP